VSDIDNLGPRHHGIGAIRNLDYTILLCDDVAAMTTFYFDVLGSELHEEVPGRWASVRIGSSLLAFRLRGRPYDGPSQSVDSASVHLAFRVPPNEVEVAASQLAALGIVPLEPLADHPFGHRTLFVADPEHNIIEIYAEI
jgi:catechol 2,3-dioxygenase-like lactoylglutathione lyase family enzyme